MTTFFFQAQLFSLLAFVEVCFLQGMKWHLCFQGAMIEVPEPPWSTPPKILGTKYIIFKQMNKLNRKIYRYDFCVYICHIVLPSTCKFRTFFHPEESHTWSAPFSSSMDHTWFAHAPVKRKVPGGQHRPQIPRDSPVFFPVDLFMPKNEKFQPGVLRL